MNIEELIFNMYKEESIGSRKFRAKIKNKYKLTDRQISDIYARIDSYQLKKYGRRIGNDYEILSKEECERRANIMRNIKSRRKKGRKKR